MRVGRKMKEEIEGGGESKGISPRVSWRIDKKGQPLKYQDDSGMSLNFVEARVDFMVAISTLPISRIIQR